MLQNIREQVERSKPKKKQDVAFKQPDKVTTDQIKRYDSEKQLGSKQKAQKLTKDALQAPPESAITRDGMRGQINKPS